jgi:hypothetical protein
MKTARAIIIDLWPLYLSGDASPETRALVEEGLREDPALAEQLHRDPVLAADVPPLAPDHEARALVRTRRRLRGLPWLLVLALVFSGQAFARIVSDTSWQVSPRNFMIASGIAGVFWIAYLLSLWRMRARILIVRGRRTTSGWW